MRRLAAGVAIGVLVGLAGCGGGDGDAAGPGASATAPPTSAPPPGDDRAGTPFCRLALAYTAQAADFLAASSDPARLRVVATDAESAIRQARATAPAEIEDDVDRVASTAGKVLTMLRKNDFDLAGTPKAVSALQEPRFRTALDRVARYGRAHCGTA